MTFADDGPESYDALIDSLLKEQRKHLASTARLLYPPSLPPPPPSQTHDGMHYTLIGALSVTGLSVVALIATAVAAYTNNRIQLPPL